MSDIAKVVEEVIKHLSGKHDQKSHGKKIKGERVSQGFRTRSAQRVAKIADAYLEKESEWIAGGPNGSTVQR